MTARSYATKWPAAFNPDDPTVLSVAAVVDEHVDVSADSPQLPLHTHPTGQLALSVGGLVGLQLESGYWSIPALCAIWVPPGVPHTGVLGLDGRSVYFHVGPSQLEGFPDEVVRMMLNPMAVEMVLFAARGLDRRRPEASRRLPPHFAPLPRSPRLQAIAMEFASFEKAEWTMEDWAAFAGMSVRTLSRQVQAETGLTFRNWRLQHVLLVSLGQLARETSVEEAALTAGYQNTSAFISAFRQVFGMTPGEYRRTLQGS